MSNSSTWEKLKDFSTVAAGAGISLYVLGYIIHVVHYYHVLGIDVPLQPLEYIKTGGDLCASVLITIPQLFSQARAYFPSLFSGTALILSSVSTIVFYVALILLLINEKRTGWTGLRSWRYRLLGVPVLVGALFLMWQEKTLLTVRNVLQTYDLAKIKEAQENTAGNVKEPLNVRLARIEIIYSDYVDGGGDKTAAFDMWKGWYNLKAERSPRQNRLSLYLALLLLNILILAAVWLYNWVLRRLGPAAWHNYLNYGSMAFTLALLIFFSSFAYAVLGKSYDYPVVTLRLSAEDADKASDAGGEKGKDSSGEGKGERETHPVYLVTQTDASIIVYDRLDFLKVKYIPRSRVAGINQLFVASPFENCAKSNGFNPCEAKWGRDDQWVEEF